MKPREPDSPGLAVDDPIIVDESLVAAIDEGVPSHVLTAALYERFASRGNDDFANQVLSAMRQAFGGHIEKAAENPH